MTSLGMVQHVHCAARNSNLMDPWPDILRIFISPENIPAGDVAKCLHPGIKLVHITQEIVKEDQCNSSSYPFIFLVVVSILVVE